MPFAQLKPNPSNRRTRRNRVLVALIVAWAAISIAIGAASAEPAANDQGVIITTTGGATR
jgi:hypothetical protein